MGRGPIRASSFLVALALLMSPMLTWQQPVLALQAESDLKFGIDLPEGVEFDVIAEGVAADTPSAPYQFRLERLLLDPGTTLDPETAPGPQLYLVESGQFSIVDELGIEGVYETGQPLYVAQGVLVQIGNGGESPSSVLRLSLVPASTALEPSSEASPTGIQSGPLFDVQQTVSIGSSIRLVIARLTFAPGAILPHHIFSGPVALLAELGSLLLAGPSGIEGKLKPDQAVVFPTGIANQQRNATDEAVSVLAVAALPLESPFIADSGEQEIDGSAGTPTEETGLVGALDQGRSEVTPTEADALPSPAATATEAPADNVLYEATAEDDGFTDWEIGAGWKLFRGMLVSDGTQRSYSAAPVVLSGTYFAIEAEIEILQPGCNVIAGMFAHGVEGEFPQYSDGTMAAWLYYSCDPYPMLSISGDRYDGSPFSHETGWHTYRMEVAGNEFTFSIDGVVQLNLSDNRLIGDSLGLIGVATESMQINVRRYTVYSLPEE